MMQYPTRYQLTLRCATWHDIIPKIYIKSRISEICESRAFKRYIVCPNRLISWMSRFRPQTLPTWEQNGAVCLLIIFRSNHQTSHLVCSLWVIIEESIKTGLSRSIFHEGWCFNSYNLQYGRGVFSSSLRKRFDVWAVCCVDDKNSIKAAKQQYLIEARRYRE